MKIELKRISYNARLSQETPAFAADVWIDGKKRGTAENDGHGGSTLIHPFDLEREIEAYAKTLPPIEVKGCGPLQPTADIVLGDLLYAFLAQRDLKRRLARKTVFVRDGKLYETKADAPPNATVLNRLPFEEAFALFTSHT